MKKNKNVKKIIFAIITVLLSVAIALTAFFLIFKKDPQTKSENVTIDLVETKKQLLECQTYYQDELALLLQEYQFPDVIAQLSEDDQKLIKYLQQQKEINLLQIQKQLHILSQIKINDNQQINNFKSDLAVINQQYYDMKTKMDQFNGQYYFLIDQTKQKIYQKCENDYNYLTQQIALQNSYFQQDGWFSSQYKSTKSFFQDGFIDHVYHLLASVIQKKTYTKLFQTDNLKRFRIRKDFAAKIRSKLQSLTADLKAFKEQANQFIIANQQLWFAVKLDTLAQKLSLQPLVARLHQLIKDSEQYQENLITSWVQELKTLLPTIPDEHIDLLSIKIERMEIIKDINEFSSLKTITSYEQVLQQQNKFLALKEQIDDFSIKYDHELNQTRKAEIKAQKDLLIYVQPNNSDIVSYFAKNNFDFSVPYDNQQKYTNDLQTSFKKALRNFNNYYKDQEIEVEKICPRKSKEKKEEDKYTKYYESFIKYYKSFIFSMNYFNHLDDCANFRKLKTYSLNHSPKMADILQLKKIYYLDYYRQKFKTSIFSELQRNHGDYSVFFAVTRIISLILSFSASLVSGNCLTWFCTLPLSFFWNNYFFQQDNTLYHEILNKKYGPGIILLITIFFEIIFSLLSGKLVFPLLEGFLIFLRMFSEAFFMPCFGYNYLGLIIFGNTTFNNYLEEAGLLINIILLLVIFINSIIYIIISAPFRLVYLIVEYIAEHIGITFICNYILSFFKAFLSSIAKYTGISFICNHTFSFFKESLLPFLGSAADRTYISYAYNKLSLLFGFIGRNILSIITAPKFYATIVLFFVVYYFYWLRPQKSTALQEEFDQLLVKAQKSDKLAAEDLEELKTSRDQAGIEQIADLFVFQEKLK